MSGKLWTCRVIDLEVVHASLARDVAELVVERRALPEAPLTPAVMDRTLIVAGLLAVHGTQRGATPADSMIAAAAESAGLVLFHYDDYERLAVVMGQPTEWIAPPGTLDLGFAAGVR